MNTIIKINYPVALKYNEASLSLGNSIIQKLLIRYEANVDKLKIETNSTYLRIRGEKIKVFINHEELIVDISPDLLINDCILIFTFIYKQVIEYFQTEKTLMIGYQFTDDIKTDGNKAFNFATDLLNPSYSALKATSQDTLESIQYGITYKETEDEEINIMLLANKDDDYLRIIMQFEYVMPKDLFKIINNYEQILKRYKTKLETLYASITQPLNI